MLLLIAATFSCCLFIIGSYKGTVYRKRERFAGLNIRVFHGFQEYLENFPMNISAFF